MTADPLFHNSGPFVNSLNSLCLILSIALASCGGSHYRAKASAKTAARGDAGCLETPPFVRVPIKRPSFRALEMQFRKRYQEPLWDSELHTGIPGISVINVYDKKNLTEDPLIPTPWLLVNGKHKLPFTEEGLARALEKVAFNPKDKNDAVDAARLSLMESGTTIILMDKASPPLPERVNPSLLSEKGVAPPKVCWNGELYVAELYTYAVDPNHDEAFGGEPVDYLDLVRFFIGRGVYRYDVEHLWSTPEPALSPPP